jgi:phenylalanyl-tRNA synthetase beta chain
MPVITFNMGDLLELVGGEVRPEEVLDRVPLIGASVDRYEPSSGETAVEFFPNRPDLYSVEGVARALRNFFDIEPGMKHYPHRPSGITMTWDEGVLAVRPHCVAGVVRNVTMSDPMIRSLMELQEKLHLTVGRKRVKVAIGVHDLDKVKPPFRYLAADPDSISFVPLAKTEPMTMREVLERHEKGIDYRHILDGKDRYPVILDKNDDVLSFPPIINGALTTVTPDTENIFIDVTGMDLFAISGVLNIVSTSLAERGGSIETVEVKGPTSMVTPDLHPKMWELDAAWANSWLGLTLSDWEICRCLGRMGYDADPAGRNIEVKVPPWRMDLMHMADLVEDLAIGHGYERFGNTPPRSQTIGGERSIERAADLVRQLMVGYGYWEVTTLTLSNPDDQFTMMRVPERELVEVLNPVSEAHTCLRAWLTPSMLAVLRKSKHRELPQRIFEVGDVLENARRRKHLAALSIHPKASFTEVKSLVEGVMRDLSAKFYVLASDSGAYIPGRGAQIVFEDETVGTFGELHPEVITNFDLGNPVVGLELDLDRVIRDKQVQIL